MKHLLLLLAFASALNAQTVKFIGSGATDIQNWWPHEDGSGTTDTARVGGTNGTLTNGPTWVSGVLGYAISFDGSNDYVDVGAAIRPTVSQAWSITVWFYDAAVDGAIHVLMGNWNGTNQRGIEIRVLTSNKIEAIIYSGISNSRTAASAATITANNWHFCVVTWDGSATLTMYLDTAATSNSTSAGTIGAMTYDNNMNFGRYTFGNSRFWNGYIDDIKFFNHKMTQSEVNYLYYSKRQAVQ